MIDNKDNLSLPKTTEIPNQRRVARNVGEVALSKEALSQWYSQRMLFVSGPHASGKSSIARTALKEGFAIFDLGPLIRSIHARELNTSLSYKLWVENNEALYGPDFSSEVLVQTIKPRLQSEAATAGSAMVGNRSMEGIEYFKKSFQPVDALIVYLNAPHEILFERYKRRESRPELSNDEFQTLLDEDKKMGLESVHENADFVIENTGDIEIAQTKFREIVGAWQPS